MGEPEHATVHNYAYHPNVASWIQSTSLATQFDGTSDEPLEPSPDDFYKSPPRHYEDGSAALTDEMAATRQRQQASDGSARSTTKTTKPAFRSASGPASTLASTRSTPHLPGNRPTVKTLAQKFNHPSSTESSPSAPRARPARRPVAESTSTSSSPARQNTEQAYGPHKFNNLKPRERPQPAPAPPTSARRVNGVRKSVDEQPSPHRRKLSSPIRTQSRQSTPGRPFFGEVVGDHDALTPGYGIANLELAQQDAPHGGENATVRLVDEENHLSPQPLFSRQSPIRHRKSPSDMTASSAGERHPAPHVESPNTRGPRRISPPSRIPVATRRMSTASDSSSSVRSFNSKAGFTRPVGRYNATSPARSNGTSGGSNNAHSTRNRISGPTLSSSRYRDHRERAKSPSSANGGHSLAAVITSSPQPPSPRLRHSNERQLPLQGSPEARPPYSDTRVSMDYFQKEGRNLTGQEAGTGQVRESGDHSQVNDVSAPIEEHVSQDANASGPHVDTTTPQITELAHERDGKSTVEPLSLHTSSLHVPPAQEPLSSTTNFSFEESPILGIPGSFLTTPPIAQGTNSPSILSEPAQEAKSPPQLDISSGELLQPRTFQPQTKSQTSDSANLAQTQNTPSEVSIRESIPIMLGADEPQREWQLPNGRSIHSPRLSIGAHKWRAEPLDASGTISFLEEDDSPTDPFANRESLRPDDSASVAFYRQTKQPSPDWTPKVPPMPEAEGLTLSSEAYSIINKVLNLYHSSDAVTPEVAYNSKQQIQEVSPIIAQHKDWTSKESTETYLARLLSDANVADAGREENGILTLDGTNEGPGDTTTHKSAGLSIQGLDEEPGSPDGGTAIIYPSESRRYSRGSRASTATTIQEDGSRTDSFSGSIARDAPLGESIARLHRITESRADPHSNEPLPSSFHLRGVSHELAEGLNVTLREQQQLRQQREQLLHDQRLPPPRPSYSPPPPPSQPSIAQAQAAALYSPSVYSRHPQSSVVPQAPGFTPQLDMCLTPGAPWPRDNIYQAYGDEPSEEPFTLGSGSSAVEAGSRSESTVHLIPPTESHETLAAVSVTESTLSAGSGAVAEVSPAEAESKRLQRRYRIMEELTHTEHMYSCDMMVVAEIFAATATEPFKDPKDRATLFGNSEEISKFSHNLWQELKTEMTDVVNQEDPPKPGEHRDESYNEFVNCTLENDAEVHIGIIFKENLGKLERLYTTYLLNHEAANKIIAANRTNPIFLGWQMACVQHCKDITDAWDLDSLLVKPTQRLLKYPLLLAELKQVTPPDHPDYQNLEYCHKELLEISDRINQAKKRQETLREATKEGKKEKKKGFSGMALVKALTNKTDKVKQPHPALADGWSDWDYDKAAQKFGGHFFQLQIVLKDVEKYRDEITACHLHLTILGLGFVQMIEAAPSSSPEIESAWRRTVMALLELRNVLLEDHKQVVRERVWKKLHEVWSLSVKPGKLIEERKKKLPAYLKYRAALERGEKIDPKLEETGKSFIGLNDTLKAELPKLYELTKMAVKASLTSFISYQMDFWKNCQKKILPLLEYEPEHTTLFSHDMEAYIARYLSDHVHVQAAFDRLSICNGNLLSEMSNFTSPLPSVYTDDGSSRKSSSRRTESIGSDISLVDARNRRSGGYNPQRGGPSFEGPPRSAPQSRDYTLPIAGPPTLAPRIYPPVREYNEAYTTIPRNERSRAISPTSEASDITVIPSGMARTHSSPAQFHNMDGAFDPDYNAPAAMASAFLSPTSSSTSSHRGSAVFNSALPMSDSPAGSIRNGKAPVVTEAELPGTPADPEEPEVLFLAASLFEFNIAHDRREGGIPYLVYVPGEIFDVIGMKGELWLARNQDDASKTVGWIWEKHFARILPEEV